MNEWLVLVLLWLVFIGAACMGNVCGLLGKYWHVELWNAMKYGWGKLRRAKP